MAHLKCDNCGSIKNVPQCCESSMVMKETYLICCCSKECTHQPIPECCGKRMRYIG